MNIWHDIEAKRITCEKFLCVVEISKGCKSKYELDKDSGMLILDRVLYTSTVYPANYGFIPRTYAEDNDPLDVLVVCSEIITPLTLVNCYPIGVIKMVDDEQEDQKIIAIPFGDPMYNGYRDVAALPGHVTDEMQHFFEVYKNLEHKKTTVRQIEGRAESIKVITECINRYNEHFGDKE